MVRNFFFILVLLLILLNSCIIFTNQLNDPEIKTKLTNKFGGSNTNIADHIRIDGYYQAYRVAPFGQPGNATAALTFFGVSIDVGFLIDFNKYQTRGFLTISRAAGIDFSYGGKITYYEPINDKRKLDIYSIKDWGSSITTSIWIFDYSSGGDEKNSSLYLKDINTNYSNYKSYSFGISNGLPIGTSITKGKTFIYGQ